MVRMPVTVTLRVVTRLCRYKSLRRFFSGQGSLVDMASYLCTRPGLRQTHARGNIKNGIVRVESVLNMLRCCDVVTDHLHSKTRLIMTLSWNFI